MTDKNRVSLAVPADEAAEYREACRRGRGIMEIWTARYGEENAVIIRNALEDLEFGDSEAAQA